MWRRRALAIVSALLLTIASVAPSTAWSTNPLGKWDKSIIYYCKSQYQFPVESWWNTVRSGINYWNNYNYGQPEFVYTTNFSACTYTIQYTGSNMPAAQTVLNVSNGTIHSAVTTFNASVAGSTWWYGANQDCTVGVGLGCKQDAFTLALHEAGHVLGIRHNTTNEILRCAGYFYSTSSISACDYYGEAAMHWSAGSEFPNYHFGPNQYAHQGYRHWPTVDDLGALDYIYP